MMTMPDTTPLMFRALELAARWHKDQVRRHPTEEIPYIAHPAAVGILLARAGEEDATVSAGVLHDVIEDCGISREEIAAELSPRVAELVAWVTHPMDVEDWQARNDAFFMKLQKAPREALTIKCADHVSNLQSLLLSARSMDSAWTMFKAGREAKLAQEHRMFDLVKGAVPAWMADLHARSLEAAEKIA